ncbi:MAG: hypothetical protein JXR37_09195 [Kiritimatiellae bacterium]|nr:hypothetical protein [Kiritimatiellia bacterium]
MLIKGYAILRGRRAAADDADVATRSDLNAVRAEAHEGRARIYARIEDVERGFHSRLDQSVRLLHRIDGRISMLPCVRNANYVCPEDP